jgi:thioredoxin reductase
MMHDAIVIGASFAGLSAAMQLARARRDVAVIDAGAPRNRFSTASHGFFGQDGRRPLAIMAEGRRELERYPSVTFIDGNAIRVRQMNDGFVVELADARALMGKKLILATGVRDELPAIAGLQERWGVSVLHCPYCHGYEVGGQKLGVLASGPMSVHQALLVADWGPTTFFTNKSFELDAEQRDKLEMRGIPIVAAAISELSGTGATLQAVKLDDAVVLPLDALFLAPRTHMASDIPEQLGCGFDEAPTGPILRVDGSKTTIPGVFAAGDISSPMWNATLAAAAGVGAGVAAHQSLIFW